MRYRWSIDPADEPRMEREKAIALDNYRALVNRAWLWYVKQQDRRRALAYIRQRSGETVAQAVVLKKKGRIKW